MRTLPVPGRNGTRPSIAAAAARITAIRSATVCETGSPVEPPTEIACEPASSCQSTSRASVSRSSSPSSRNGVISGVIAPRIASGLAAKELIARGSLRAHASYSSRRDSESG